MFPVGKKFMLLFHPWRKFGIDSVSWVNGVKGKIIKTRMKACPGMNESQSNLRAVLWHP